MGWGHKQERARRGMAPKGGVSTAGEGTAGAWAHQVQMGHSWQLRGV